MLKKIATILTSKWLEEVFRVVKYIFVIIFVFMVAQETLDKPPVKMGPTPAQALVILQQEHQNFRRPLGSEMRTSPTGTKERRASFESYYTYSGTYQEDHSYYIEEAKRNGWILEKEDGEGHQITFGKSDFPKSKYRLYMGFSNSEIKLIFSWESGY